MRSCSPELVTCVKEKKVPSLPIREYIELAENYQLGHNKKPVNTRKQCLAV